jgi:uncharacterized protein
MSNVHRSCALPEEGMAIEEKPSRNEDEYFKKLDADLMKERRARLDEERRKAERLSHYNKCPKCGCDLEEREHNGVKIDQCSECAGIWLDAGELELIEEIDRKSPPGAYSFMQSLLKLVR